jgi:hypothetical protein
MAVLTTAAPKWNNWARDNPSFVVVMLELESYLAAGKQTDPARQVGAPLSIPVDTQKYQQQIEFLTPAEGAADKVVVKAESQADAPPTATLADTQIAGFYDVQLTPLDNSPQEIQSFAYNVDPAEGDLNKITPEQLSGQLKDVNFEFHNASEMDFDNKDVSGVDISEIALYSLIALLVGEQLLAYSASYHPTRPTGGQAT